MREDSPAYLTTSADCLSRTDCGVDGTEFATGDELLAVCQTTGLDVTNRFGDTPNPENHDSNIWYGIEHDASFGYISEVWIHERHRGGLNLRTCDPSG